MDWQSILPGTGLWHAQHRRQEVTSAVAILDATPRLFAPTILRQKVYDSTMNQCGYGADRR